MTDTPNTIWPKTQWVNRTRNWLAGDYDPVQLELPGMPKPPTQPDEPGARMLPFVLHAMADKGGLVIPRQTRLAAVCGVHVRTVRKWIERLKRRGLLVIPAGMIGYRGKATTYRLVQPEWLIVRAEAKEKADAEGRHRENTEEKADAEGLLNERKADAGVQKAAPEGLPGRSLKGLSGGRERAERLTKATAAAMDATNPLEDSDPGCDKHGWSDPGEACGGCRKARERRQAREQREKQQRQAMLDREHSDMVKRELDRAEANRATNVQPGHVARLIAEQAAAEPAEPDNPDPQAGHICTHGRNGRPADARGPKRCQTCRHELTPEQLQQAQDEHIARARAKASA